MAAYGPHDEIHILITPKNTRMAYDNVLSKQGGSDHSIYRRYGALLPKSLSPYKPGAVPGILERNGPRQVNSLSQAVAGVRLIFPSHRSHP